MAFKIAADLVVIFHFVFIVFAILGGLLVLWKRWFIWVHIPAALWSAAISFGGWICPLTPLEVYLRHSAGQQGYQGGFIEHYIIPIIYPEGFTRDIAIMLGIAVLIINLSIYGFVIYKYLKK